MDCSQLNNLKNKIFSIGHILKDYHLLIFKHLKLSSTPDLHQQIQKYYSRLKHWIASIHAAHLVPVLSCDLKTPMAPYSMDSSRVEDISSKLRSWIHAIQTASKWLGRVPHNAWTTISNFFKGVGHGIMVGINFTINMVEITLLIIVGLIILGICVQLSSYAIKLLREKHQEAERQRLLEAFERQQAERRRRADELREQWARQREDEERRRAEEEEQRRRQRARAAEERIQKEAEARRRAAQSEAEAKKKRIRDETEEKMKQQREEAEKLIKEVLRKRAEQQHLQDCFNKWQADSKEFFRNLETEPCFPEPGIGKCGECRDREGSEQGNKGLRICIHSLEKLLRVPGGYWELLKKERIRWHPDRFARTSEVVRGNMIRKATALSQMIGELLEREKSRAEG
jgi:ABC-type multidrug transport system fused ATPase/permease subunit